jgi:hypothetical protein
LSGGIHAASVWLRGFLAETGSKNRVSGIKFKNKKKEKQEISHT